MKISAYNYHMHVHHGINHHTGLPLDPPVKFRARDVVHKKAKGNSNGRGAGGSGGEGSVNGTAAAARDRQVMKQGLCHVCKKWVDLQSVKDVDVKVSVRCTERQQGRATERTDAPVPMYTTYLLVGAGNLLA